ncbi:MAG: PhnB protein [Myxococcales bacterium]|jgi:PhnB protein|nr:PhnB protein [Myxococcales bacterium]
MATKVKAIPDGYHSVTPYLSIKGAKEALEFYKRAFGAEEIFKMEMPDGRLGHAEIQIGNSRLMLSDEMPEMAEAITRSPKTLGGSTAGFSIYLENVDARFQQAIDAGATVMRPVTTQFYGDRSGTLQDPFGHLWTLSTHVEDISPDEMNARMAKLMGG